MWRTVVGLLGLVAFVNACGSSDGCQRADDIKKQIVAAWDADDGLDAHAAGPGAVPCVLDQSQRDAIVAARKAAGSAHITDYAALCRQFDEADSACKG